MWFIPCFFCLVFGKSNGEEVGKQCGAPCSKSNGEKVGKNMWCSKFLSLGFGLGTRNYEERVVFPKGFGKKNSEIITW